MTIANLVALRLAGMDLFDATCHAFSTVATGGFSTKNASIGHYNSVWIEGITIFFMLLSSIHLGITYATSMGRRNNIFRTEGSKFFLATTLLMCLMLSFSLWHNGNYASLGESLRHGIFQGVSIVTSTGFATADTNIWPAVCICILVYMSVQGGMAGSTAGGMKTSRIVIAVKALYTKMRKLINPRHVAKTKFEGKTLSESTVNDVFSFITMYLFILVSVFFLLSFDPVNGTTVTIVSDAGEYTVKHNLFSSLSSVLACISNVGPAFEAVGPYSSFAGYTLFSKLLLSFTMILGRLEILPVLLLFSPKTWKKT
jgi:trk system potassium uptake protein TrkH